MFLATFRSIAFVAFFTACSGVTGEGTSHGQNPLSPSSTSGEVTPDDAGMPTLVDNCVDIQCPAPPPEWCGVDHTDSPIPAFLIAYWNESCEAVCGNGILDDSEVCDDGNTVSGDGCAADCATIESDFNCAAPGAPCN